MAKALVVGRDAKRLWPSAIPRDDQSPAPVARTPLTRPRRAYPFSRSREKGAPFAVNPRSAPLWRLRSRIRTLLEPSEGPGGELGKNARHSHIGGRRLYRKAPRR